jgi:hypothetical protein
MTQDFNGNMTANIMEIDVKKPNSLSKVFDIDNLPECLEKVFLNNAQLRESFFYSTIKEHSLQEALEQAIVHLSALNNKEKPYS